MGLIEHLVDQGLLREGDIARAEAVSARTGTRMPATLARLGIIAEDDLAEQFATLHGLARLDPDLATAEPFAIIDDLNRTFLRRRAVAPIARKESALTLAMADPDDNEAKDALAFAAGVATVEPVVATFSEIAALLGPDPQLDDDPELAGLSEGSGAADDIERLIEGESDAPVIRLVQRILTAAVMQRASDVHIEPMARHVVVRYRIDGRLAEIERHSDALAGPVASRIKVLAGLDISETRLPQDGRLRLTVEGRDVDVRVATSPIANGESIVLRLLGRQEVPLDLARLGLPATALTRLEAALDRPHGIILLTGPTGSGKTTTLYAAINRLRRPEVKILTVEDPVEVLLEGINQVQVRPDIDLTYAATLRAFLRQDPDILMIGEIRDHETAEIAMRAALTGHLVLSTLHTNTALGAFTRLADIGIEPYLTASTVIATIAQRLIRALCDRCKTWAKPDDATHALFVTHGSDAPTQIAEAAGCVHCQQDGYRGRVPLIEVVMVNEPLREAIRTGATEALTDVLQPADTLFGHGLALVAAGRTTLAEVQRAVSAG